MNPTPQQAVAAVFDRVADGYDKESLRLFPFCADRLLNHLRPAPGSRICDVGAGTGVVTVAVAQEVGPEGRVHAVDMAERMLDRCQHHARLLGLNNVDLHAMDGQKLEFKSDYFDAVVSSFVIQFLPDMAAALKSWMRVTRRGGRVLFTAFGEEAFQPLIDRFKKDLLSHGGRLPEGGSITNQKRIDSAEKCRALLMEVGLDAVSVAEEQIGYHLATTEDWWELVTNSGFRALLDTLPEDAYEAFRAEHLAAIGELRGEDGIWLNIPALIAWGTKP
ncbi:class I SAM-dependent methyltransferase [Endothiovibrio diazotrophicus]